VSERGVDDLEQLASVLGEVEDAARARIDASTDLRALREAEREMLGRGSALARLHSSLSKLKAVERPQGGAMLNAVRKRLSDQAEARAAELGAAERARRIENERVDLTELLATLGSGFGSEGIRGHTHIVSQTRDELEDTFVAMGFAVVEGPEVETDWYNFEALNMPPAHPARGMWQTLYLKLGAPGEVLLRTHTSPGQIRLMQNQKPPIYAVVPGKCYRRDTPDARHLPVFHQIEGLVVDRGITFADLAGTIEAFTTAFFGSGMHSRLRPSYFPFTEPSAEFEVTCPICEGSGSSQGSMSSDRSVCRTCSGAGWIELGGCGMVDPNVFAAVGIDPEEYSGFAFGFGIDRLAQVRAQLSDMRAFIDNDVRFLQQF
jgi:phenylalanyl-tRNA synthetase alpha chain